MTRAADLAKLIAGGGSITVDDNSDNVTLTSTDADANAGPNLRMYRNSASPADVDRLGHITFDGRNDNSQDFTAAQIQVFTEDASDGTEDSSVTFTCINGGSANNAIQINPTETTFNESSVDRDFRVESNGDTHALFVDAGNDSMGLFTDTTDTAYHKVNVGLTGTVISGDTDGATITSDAIFKLVDDTNWSSTNSTIFLTGGGTGGSVTGQISSAIGFARESNTHWGTQLKFYTHPPDTSDLDDLDERMRISASGQLLLNTTSTTVNSNSGRIITINKGNMAALHVGADSTSSSTGIVFTNPNGTVGSVTMSGSGTAFNTSSDYRLKENVVTDWDATSRLKQLKPSRFNFKTDKKTTMDGFLAHEVSSIVPEAISGDKDETQDVGTIKDKDGNVLQENVLESEKKDGQTWTKTETQNVYQGIDQSKLVPLMVKTIQELEARIATLESK